MTGVAFDVPTVETERLILRMPRMSDFDAYASFGASERSKGVGGPFLRSESFERLAAIIGHWHLRGYGRWMVADKAGDRPLGIVGLMYPTGWPEPEVAWSVFDDAEGKGIALEAALAARRFAYDVLGWTRVISCTAPDNVRSVALAKRMGAVYEGDFQHETIGTLNVWRHLSPQELAPAQSRAMA